MNYDQARKNIKSGDLLAWSHRGWRTLADWQIQAIRVFGRTEYSHVGIAWRIAGRLFVMRIAGVDLGERAVPSSLVERALQQGFPCYLVEGE